MSIGVKTIVLKIYDLLFTNNHLRGIGWKGKRCAGGCCAIIGAGGCTGTGTGCGGGGGGGSWGSVLYGGGGMLSTSSGTRCTRDRRVRLLRAGSSVWHSALTTLRSLSVCTALFTLQLAGASCTCTCTMFTLDTLCRLGSPGTRTETESDLRSGPGAGTGNRISWRKVIARYDARACRPPFGDCDLPAAFPPPWSNSVDVARAPSVRERARGGVLHSYGCHNNEESASAADSGGTDALSELLISEQHSAAVPAQSPATRHHIHLHRIKDKH